MKAVKLKIKNFMAIRELEINVDKFVQVTGANSQGKTSVLKAIETIFTGSTDGRFIKHGEEQAELILELPDETIRRTLRKEGHSVSVTKGEFKVTSPQTYLETIMDFRAFNPLSFLDPKNRKQAILEALAIKVTPEKLAEYAGEAVENLPPVDYDQDGLKVIERAYEFYYARRAEANKDALAKKTEYEVRAKDFQPIVKPGRTREEIAQQKELINANIQRNRTGLSMADLLVSQNKKAVDKVERFKSALAERKQQKEESVFRFNEEIEEMERRIITMRENLKSSAAAFDTVIQDGERFLAEAEKEVKVTPDTAPFHEVIKLCEEEIHSWNLYEQELVTYENNAKAASMVQDLKLKADAASSVAEALNSKVEALKDAKSKAIQESSLPIKGLEVFQDEYYVNGTRLDELSTSESVMIGLQVAQILAKKTKLIAIDKFESLDRATRTKFIEMARPDEFIYIFADVEGDPMPGVQTITMLNGAAAV